MTPEQEEITVNTIERARELLDEIERKGLPLSSINLSAHFIQNSDIHTIANKLSKSESDISSADGFRWLNGKDKLTGYTVFFV